MILDFLAVRDARYDKNDYELGWNLQFTMGEQNDLKDASSDTLLQAISTLHRLHGHAFPCSIDLSSAWTEPYRRTPVIADRRPDEFGTCH